MATSTQNAGGIPDCGTDNKDLINNRTTVETDLSDIRAMLQRYQSKIASSTDSVIRNFDRATSFPAAELLQMLQSTDCAYLRVYNGLTEANEFVTFIAPVDEHFTLLPDNVLMISQACCHCKPCTLDILLNS